MSGGMRRDEPHSRVRVINHHSDDFGFNDGGCYPARCGCGWDGGMFPSDEDAADALMEHAREQGYLEAQRDAIAMQGSS